MVKELTKIVIDWKTNNKESSRKPFKPCKKKIKNPNPQEAKGVNFEEETMDDWYRAHNDYHLEKKFCKFIDMYNVFFASTMECKKGNFNTLRSKLIENYQA